MMPRRVQRKRTKGYKIPEGAIYVGRPSKWANPYKADRQLQRSIRYKAVVDLFRSYAEIMLKSDPHWLDPLKGKDLACWCDLAQPCHSTVLLEMAEKTEATG